MLLLLPSLLPSFSLLPFLLLAAACCRLLLLLLMFR